MLNSARFQILHNSLNRSRVTSASAALSQRKRISAFIAVDGNRVEANVQEAAGYDLLVRTRLHVPIRKNIEVIFLSAVPTVEITASGIVHWTQKTEGLHESGIVLGRPVPNEFLVAHPSCERTSIRYQCAVQAMMTWHDDQSRSQTRILNYSRHGLCFQLDTNASIGRQFTMAFDDTPGITIDGTVRWTVGQGDLYLAGCSLQRGFGYHVSGLQISDL